jgi:hypothetical protein
MKPDLGGSNNHHGCGANIEKLTSTNNGKLHELSMPHQEQQPQRRFQRSACEWTG